MLLKPRVRQGIKIGLALLSIPLIAWMLEFAYTHYLSPRFRRTTAQHMILSDHGSEGYDYAALNTLLRKVDRLERERRRHTPEKSIDIEPVTRLQRALENEEKAFIAYYYDTLDLYARAGMPLKLRRRLHYYRNIIQKAVGRVSQLMTDKDLTE